MAEITGTVERITYYNDENHFTVAKIQRENKEHLTTIVGYLPMINIGETLRLKGNWVNHSDYGTQFRVEEYQITVPATLNGIEKYLGSGLIKGIGPKTAKKLVKHFKLETLNIIEFAPHRLTEIDGIGEKKAEAISAAFAEQKDIQQVMMFLQSNGVSPTYAVKIFKEYKEKTIEYIKQNPYRMADEIFGIGFKTADKIAQKLGIETTSIHRITAGVRYVLGQYSNDGHTYVTFDELVEKASGVLEVTPELAKKGITELLNKEQAFCQDFPDGEKAVYLAPFYFAERGSADRIFKLESVPYKKFDIDINKEIHALEKESGVKLSRGQKEALEKVLKNAVLVITGGPGTGKTTTIKSIIKLLEKQKQKIVLAAPTGRAARRMAEATGREAKTIHRLLEYGFTEGGGMTFQKNEDNPIDADVVIVDEVSMVDLLLFYNLLKAIQYGTRLILVGDIDQLPSVGAGNVLKDIINSGVTETVRLTEIFRQARESMIVVNAHNINNGKFPYLNNRDGDFFMIEKQDPEEVLQTILDLCSKRLPRYGPFNPIQDIQVLTPMKRTIIGVNNLNSQLQNILNPPNPAKEEKRYGAVIFREGDKVMQIKNNYTKEVFNGDIGTILKIDNEEGEVIVRFPDVTGERDIVYETAELEELTLSYAVSVHKSQGSEYPVVVMPITTQHYLMLQRNLLYTAITRAKKLVVLVGTKKALAIAVKNNKVNKRYSRLADRIRQFFNQQPES